MKISKPLFARIQAAVESAIEAHKDKMEEIKANYEIGNIPRAAGVTDLQVRFCYDIWWQYVSLDVRTDIMRDAHSEKCNDAHLMTALRKVCPAVTRRY